MFDLRIDFNIYLMDDMQYEMKPSNSKKTDEFSKPSQSCSRTLNHIVKLLIRSARGCHRVAAFIKNDLPKTSRDLALRRISPTDTFVRTRGPAARSGRALDSPLPHGAVALVVWPRAEVARAEGERR